MDADGREKRRGLKLQRWNRTDQRSVLQFRKELGGAQDGGGMEAGGVFAVAIVAAPVEDGGGGSRSRDELQNVLVAGREVGVGKFHLAKAVVLVGVGASDPKNEFGGEVGKSRREGGFELLKVVGAADVTGEFDVEGAGSFYGRVVFPDVNRVGKDAGIGGEDGMGAVTLVGISI